MRNGRLAAAVLGFLAAAIALPAAAQDDTGLYLGGSFGYSQYKDVCIQRANVPCDDHDQAWRFYGGYQFNRYVAAELGYADLGAVTGEGPVPGGRAKFEFAVGEVLDLSAVFRIPVVGRLSALAKVGGYRARTTVDDEGPFPGSPSHEAGTNSGLTYGLGAEYAIWKIGVRAEWQRYENVGAASTGEVDIDVFSIGALIRF
jgi:OmpA-OmpF porin, OOP family